MKPYENEGGEGEKKELKTLQRSRLGVTMHLWHPETPKSEAGGSPGACY